LVRQTACLRARVAEELLEYEDDVSKGVDGVVPDDDDPRDVAAFVHVAEKLLDGVGDGDLVDSGRRHHSSLSTSSGRTSSGRTSSGRTSSAMRASRPLTNRPESFVEYCFASSTASVMMAPVGVSITHASSYVPRRSS